MRLTKKSRRHIKKAMRGKLWVSALPLFFVPAWTPSRMAGADQKTDASKEAAKEVRALEGT